MHEEENEIHILGSTSTMYKKDTLHACIHGAIEKMLEGEVLMVSDIRRKSGCRESWKTARQALGRVRKKSGVAIEVKRPKGFVFSIKLIKHRDTGDLLHVTK